MSSRAMSLESHSVASCVIIPLVPSLCHLFPVKTLLEEKLEKELVRTIKGRNSRRKMSLGLET